jgi:Mn-dependent DtxR family transcriptional regulator
VNERVFRTFRGYQLIEQEKATVLTPSMEDYLEMIYRKSQEDAVVRVNQLAERLNVQAPSVTRTLRKLATLGFIKHHRYGLIELTDKGHARGKYLLGRHETVEAFLVALGVDNAFLDAELIEHHITGETLAVLELWLRFLEANPAIAARFAEYRQAAGGQGDPRADKPSRPGRGGGRAAHRK